MANQPEFKDSNGTVIKIGDAVKLTNRCNPGKGAALWIIHHTTFPNNKPAEVTGFAKTRVKVYLPEADMRQELGGWTKGRTVTIAPEYLIVQTEEE